MSMLQQPIPIFESGYALRVDDLDNLFNYLDNGERHTRICLIGAGIFYGLEVTVEAGPKLNITAGAGATSQGYLYCEEAKSFTKYKKLDKYSSAYLTNINNMMEGDVATLMNKSLLKPTTPPPFDLTEVFELDETGDKILSNNDLNERVVVLVFERTSEKRNGCTTCNKGTNGNIVVRYLLLKKTEWDKVPKNCSITHQIIQKSPQFPYLQRFGVNNGCVQHFNYASSVALNEQYQTVVGSAMDRLLPILNQVVDSFAPVFNRKKEDDTKIVNDGTNWVKQNPISKQYSYDYTKHLIQTYTEFSENLFVQSTAQLPPQTCFPKYLTLARFEVSSVSETNLLEKAEVKTDVRLTFYRPPFADTSMVFEEAQFLYERLMTMLTTVNLLFDRHSTHENDRLDIKITPSRSFLSPLSSRAIPYYFEGANLRPKWHFQLTKTNRTQSIAAYNRSNETVAPFNEPLLYQNAFDNADFYRIEGHIGLHLGTVWNRIVGNDRAESVGLRTCLNLPFSVEIVELSPNTEGVKTIFTRLEDFAKAHTGLEHQGGVMRGGTLVLVVENQRSSVLVTETDTKIRTLTVEQEDVINTTNQTYKVVADFCLPYWVAEKPRALPAAIFKEIARAEPTANTKGWLVVFENKSVNAARFEWFVDGKLVIPTLNAAGNPTLSFDFDDAKETKRTFVVTLVALSKDDDLPSDMATQGVSLTRIVKEKVEPPVADFELVSRASFFEEGVEGEKGIQLGEILSFENRSVHADKFTWSVSPPVSFQTQANDKAKLIAQFSFSAPPYTVSLKAENSLDVTLFAEAHLEVIVTPDALVANFEITKRESQLGVLGREDVYEETVTIQRDLIKSIADFEFVQPENVHFGNKKEATTALSGNTEVVLVNTATNSIRYVDGLTASQNMEARRQDFFKKIGDEGHVYPPLSINNGFRSVLGFIEELDKVVTEFDTIFSLPIDRVSKKLDEFDETFNTNVLQMIENIKQPDGVPPEAYRNILRNFLFFYLDKLVHLMPNGLTKTTESSMKHVLAKIKAENSFGTHTLDEVRQAWQVADITTVQNVPIVTQLSGLFD